MFGKAGVGKSTISSWISSIPGLFDVGTGNVEFLVTFSLGKLILAGTGTTTLGTWLSSTVVMSDYCSFAEDQFKPVVEIETIPPLPDTSFCFESSEHLAFIDTEGLDYQTELGENYDILTILPHTLIAENVFLVVRDRLNPNEVKELIDRLAKAAEKTNGTFPFRDDKLFGNLIIIVNKSQDISSSDEDALNSLIDNNPSLIQQIDLYFNGDINVVLLPRLEWNYELRPDFDEDGFFLDYNHIMDAHPPLRDRMLYGLNKIAFHITSGVSKSESYFINCENFEELLSNIYDGTFNIFIQKSWNQIFYLLFSNK